MKSTLKRAQKLLQQKKSNPDKAIKLLTPLIRKKVSHWTALHLMGMALIKKGDLQKAVTFLKRAVDQGSTTTATHLYLSICYERLQEYAEAEKWVRKVIEEEPDHFKAWMHLGSIYKNRAELNKSLQCYRQANQIDPKSADVALKIGEIYQDQGMDDRALDMFDIVLKMDSGNSQACLKKSLIYKLRHQLDEAEQCLMEAKISTGEIKIESALQISLAEIRKAQGEYSESIRIYEDLLEKYPSLSEARSNYAICLLELGQFDQAERQFLKATEDKENLQQPLSSYLMGLHYNPQRTRDEIFEAHKLWDKHFAPKTRPKRPVPADLNPDRYLRIGFLSGGFRRHPVGWMITAGLENLDPEQFQLYFYTTHNKIDDLTRRLHQVSTKWQPVTGFIDEVIAEMIREDQIDILVDLSGHAADNRLKVIALEPAPVTVKWVGGLFNTTGLQSVDYLITDRYETPTGTDQYYVEKLVRMPDDYICYESPEYAPEVSPLPAEKNGFITFGCFNNPTKVNPVLLKRWAEILNRIPNSQLFLKSRQYEHKDLRDRITKNMKDYGISDERIQFEGHSPHQELLEAYNQVDIALDPWPYSGGLTTCEALWMGVPVITLPGPTFAGRHSTSHLNNAGCPEWVTQSVEEYIEAAVQLASEKDQLSKIRSELRRKVRESPLCDKERFGNHLGVAFREMWGQRLKGYELGYDVSEKQEWRAPIDIPTS